MTAVGIEQQVKGVVSPTPLTQPPQKGLKITLALVGPPQGDPPARTQVERAVQTGLGVTAAHGYRGLLPSGGPSGAQRRQEPQGRLVHGKDPPLTTHSAEAFQ